MRNVHLSTKMYQQHKLMAFLCWCLCPLMKWIFRIENCRTPAELVLNILCTQKTICSLIHFLRNFPERAAHVSPTSVVIDFLHLKSSVGFRGGSVVKESTCNAGDPGPGRSSGEGNGNPLQYLHHQLSGHELGQNPWETGKDREAWHAAVHGVAKSRRQLQQTVETTVLQRPKLPSPTPGQPSVRGADPEEGRLPPPVLRRKEPGARSPSLLAPCIRLSDSHPASSSSPHLESHSWLIVGKSSSQSVLGEINGKTKQCGRG